MSAWFQSAHAAADHWGPAAKACLDRLPQVQGRADLGIVYVTADFAGDLASIVTFLRETTRVEDWIAAAAPGIIAGNREIRSGGALTVMLCRIPGDQYRLFSGADSADFAARLGGWSAAHGPTLALAHGDCAHPSLPALIESGALGADFLVGGLVESHLCGNGAPGVMSGVLFGQKLEAVVGLTQGCTPIGPVHVVTEGADNVAISLDGRPALDVLKQEVGELMARDLRRIAGYIHVGLPLPGDLNLPGSGGVSLPSAGGLSLPDAGGDSGAYMVRMLLGIDPVGGGLALGDSIEIGRRLQLVRRDPASAQADLDRMLADVAARLAGRTPLAAIYISCTARGEYMFGERGAEVGRLRNALGPAVPLIGFYAGGEICGKQLYTFTGVLTVLTEADH
jgi:small ligand-binding sensory domain FIST